MSITTGFTQPCSLKVAGINTVQIISAEDVSSFAVETGTGADSDTFGTVTLVSGKTFIEFEFEQGKASWKDEVTVSGRQPMVKHTLEFYMNGISKESQKALQEFIDNTPCGMIAIVTDNNNEKWVLGYSILYAKKYPLRLESATADTMKALGEEAGTTVILSATDITRARSFSGTLS